VVQRIGTRWGDYGPEMDGGVIHYDSVSKKVCQKRREVFVTKGSVASRKEGNL